MKYVCLLRGINVGGNQKVSMAELRIVFEKLGYSDIITYINSGNIIFSSINEPPTAQIEVALLDSFGFSIPVLILSSTRLHSIVDAIPMSWQNDKNQKSDVLFLLPDIDEPNIIEGIGCKPDIESISYVPGALISSIDRKYQTRSSLLKLMGTPLYKRMTIRNVNTARKLAELCQ